MPDYTITLTTEQDAAFDALILRVNATLPEGAEPSTKESWAQERAAGFADRHVAQKSNAEAQDIAQAYKLADDAKKAAVKDTLLGVKEVGARAAFDPQMTGA